jgi:prophage maintenance system killer protein
VSAPTLSRVLDLEAIEATLRDLHSHFPEINKLLKSRRDTIDDGLIANMMTGYELVDNLVTRHLDLFAMGNLKLFLEMNAVVLCGRDEQSRMQAASHLAATEQRFYEQEDGGIRDIVEWYELHRAKSPWERAAGVYVHMLSEPELFIEGNHRTGALVMSYILAREGRPPFVLTAANARAYLDPSTLITETRKRSLVAVFRLPKIKRYFAKFLKQHADRKYLIVPSTGSQAQGGTS